MIVRLPAGFKRLKEISTLTVAHERFASDVAAILATGTFYHWAASHPERKEYQGRRPVYSAPLPHAGARVVVRHAWRGGLLAPLLRDLWLPPTPAPRELLISAILARAGVPTPPVVAFATYRAAGLLRRVDLMTVEVDGPDLARALALRPPESERQEIVRAVAQLVSALHNAGAWHQDLNAKNILIGQNAAGAAVGIALDVDRVQFVPAGDPHALEANIERLARSSDKYRARGEAALTAAEFQTIRDLVRSDEATRAQARETAFEAL